MTHRSLPESLPSALGPIAVHLIPDLKDPEFPAKDLLGFWNEETRQILLRANSHPATIYHTLVHEWIHAMLWDQGAHIPEEIEERVCDILATALVSHFFTL